MRVSPAPPSAAGPQNPPPPLSHPSHSPHMSPAVGAPGSVVMPPHPNSGQTENRTNNMHTPGYPPGAPPHMTSGPPGPHGYPSKMGHLPPGSPYAQPGYQQPPGSGHQQYPPTRPQGHMMQPYPQNYPPPGGPQGPQGHQYAPRPPPHNSHVPPNQPYGYSHYGQQGWGAQGMSQQMMSSIPGKGGPSQMPPGQPSSVPPPGSNSIGVPRPHYLKQHIQHKMGVYSTPSSTPQMYPNGPGMPPNMVNNRESPQNNMPPPTSTPQPITPSSTPGMDHEQQQPQSQPQLQPQHPSQGAVPPSSGHGPVPGPTSLNNSTGAPPIVNNVAPSIANSVNSNPPQIGPDGNPIVDEASQQSTVSNTSGASGDDRSCTPKLHKEGLMSGIPSIPRGPGDMLGGMGSQQPPPHTSTPMNSAPSPGTASMTSQQDEFENVNSPGGWPRSPSGNPVFVNNQQPPPHPEVYRATKASDSIMRLYDMSDMPERRAWLDRLLRFMEENKSPITTCPTISKNPLDLYALYLHVRDRGGFVEVTKNKHWKDVAAVMGIGASSSGSYTLRRHYMKHILAFECKFDRGGIDPQPIINQIESSQKKKSTKTMSVPSPGSNNSSMDGFSNGPHMPGGPPGMPGPYPQYPPTSDLPAHMQQRPPAQSGPGFQGYQGNQYPGYQGMHGAYGQGGYPNSGYPPDSRAFQPQPPPNQGSFPGYQQAGFQRPGFPPPPQQRYQPEQYPMGNSGAPGPTSNFGGSQLAKQLLNPPPQRPSPTVSGPVVQNYQYPPKPGGSPSPGPQPPNSTAAFQGPRRHPDFEKGQPGWRPPGTQFGAFGPQGPPQQGPWPRPSDSGPPSGPPGAAPQWSQPRFPPPPSQNFPNQPRWTSSFGSGVGSPRGAVPPSATGKFLVAPQATSFKSVGYGAYMGKQLFPMDSVEAVTPVLVKRKRLTRPDVAPVDPWKLFMSLRCGLASEVTWALDVLNILLFDDQTIVYFGLNHMPGLLETLIEHLRRGLINMFNICSELELGRDDEATGANKRVKAEQHDYEDRPWFVPPPGSPALELDLGRLEEEANPCDKEILLQGFDYTLASRTGNPVRVVRQEGTIFMREGTRDWDKWEGFDSGVDTWSVGGGECTAHIICSVKSSVPPLPFTRLIPGKNELPRLPELRSTEPQQSVDLPVKTVPDEVKDECRKSSRLTNQCVIKIEKLDDIVDKKLLSGKISSCVDINVKKDCESRVTPTKADPKTTTTNNNNNKLKGKEISASIGVLNDSSCNGPSENSTPKAPPVKNLFNNPKIGRKNNKTSKLDAIVNRIKREPSDGVGFSIFNKCSKDMTDSKSILDHYLKKEDSSDPVVNNSEKSVKEPNSSNTELVLNKELCEKADAESDKKDTDDDKQQTNKAQESSKRSAENNNNKLSLETKATAPIRSPSKLPSIPASPNKPTSDNSRRDSANFKRPYDHLEPESWGPDEASLTTTTEGQDWLARRVIAVGTIVRNLSFVPGNEDVMSKNAPLLALLGKTILLHHSHPTRAPATTHYDRDEDTDFSDWCSSLAADTYWWWPYLHHIHENTLVTIANFAGNLDLSYYPEEISRPILDGLLHWVTCPASYGQDPLPGGGVSPQSALSPQRLALESLVKFCVLDSNTDLVLATPPFSRLDMLCAQLTRLTCRGEEQVLREFSINLFHYFSAADSGVARVIAMQSGCVSHLLSFIEEAEAAALSVANLQGVSALKENPELMGTSLDMVRRSANTLVNLSRVPDNARVITACESRFLSLVMSQILDTYVASQLSQVLFNVAQIQRDWTPPPSPPLSPSDFMEESVVLNEDAEDKLEFSAVEKMETTSADDAKKESEDKFESDAKSESEEQMTELSVANPEMEEKLVEKFELEEKNVEQSDSEEISVEKSESVDLSEHNVVTREETRPTPLPPPSSTSGVALPNNNASSLSSSPVSSSPLSVTSHPSASTSPLPSVTTIGDTPAATAPKSGDTPGPQTTPAPPTPAPQATQTS